MPRYAAILGVMLLLFASQGGWADDRPQRPIIPGDVIVTFKPQTEGDRLLRRATESPADAEAALDSLALTLGNKVGVPLLIKQRPSGHRLLLGINCAALETLVAEQLRSQRAVAKIDIQARSSRACSPSNSPPTLIVEWASGGPDTQEDLSGTVTVPHSLGRDDRARLIVELDVPTLTLTLVDRLKHLPDLDSAQPNYVMTIR
jgi:hypothetical protein